MAVVCLIRGGGDTAIIESAVAEGSPTLGGGVH